MNDRSRFFLRPLSREDSRAIFQLLQTIGKEENAFHNDVNGMSYQEFREWLVLQEAWAKGERLPKGYVRQWTFWLCVDDVPVGYGKLREHVTESSRLLGGNIGYAIGADYRGKGYGTVLFELLLAKAEELQLKEIVSTVEKNNLPSRRVHEKCGMLLLEETPERWVFYKNLATDAESGRLFDDNTDKGDGTGVLS